MATDLNAWAESFRKLTDSDETIQSMSKWKGRWEMPAAERRV